MGKKGNEGKAAVKENGYQTKLPQAFLNGFFLKFQTAVPDGKGQEEQNAKVYGSAAQDACKGASGAYFKDGRRDGALSATNRDWPLFFLAVKKAVDWVAIICSTVTRT